MFKKFNVSIWIAIIFFILYYLPWFNPALQIVKPHDTLDSEVVYNQILGKFYRTWQPESIALNGQIPIFTFSRLLQPMSLLYSINNAWWAYALSDILVRSISFLGMYWLAKQQKLPTYIAVLLAICFTTSISYSVYLLSIAGLPLLWYAFLQAKHVSTYQFLGLCAIVAFIGSNTALALSGIFIAPILLPIIYFLFHEPISWRHLKLWIIWGLGLFLGNANLFYTQFVNTTTWHRSDWHIPVYPDTSVSYFLYTWLKSAAGINWYHVSYPFIFALGTLFLGLCIARKRSKSGLLCAGIWLSMTLLYAFSHTHLSNSLRQINPIFVTFQWDRFYFLYSTIVILGILFVWKAIDNDKWSKRLLIFGITAQIICNIAWTPHWYNTVRWIMGKPIAPSFTAYYRLKEFEIIKEKTNNQPVMSVGLDPMIATMNGLHSIDGYYVMYPLTYKHAFRSIIAKSAEQAGKMAYFDDWGSRIYAFYPEGHADLLDFCAAHDLGAQFVISIEPINMPVLLPEKIHQTNFPLFLYQISEQICQK